MTPFPETLCRVWLPPISNVPAVSIVRALDVARRSVPRVASVPEEMLVVPLKVLAPDKTIFPAPDFVRLLVPAPLTSTPETRRSISEAPLEILNVVSVTLPAPKAMPLPAIVDV